MKPVLPEAYHCCVVIQSEDIHGKKRRTEPICSYRANDRVKGREILRCSSYGIGNAVEMKDKWRDRTGWEIVLVKGQCPYATKSNSVLMSPHDVKVAAEQDEKVKAKT